MGTELTRDGQKRYEIDLAIDGRKLATDYPSKLNAQVRTELLALEHRLSVLALVVEALDSCTRVYWQLLESLSTDIAELSKPIESFHTESNAKVPRSIAVLLPAGAYRNPGPSGRIQGVPEIVNPMNLVRAVNAALAELRALAASDDGSGDRNDVRILESVAILFFEDTHGDLSED